jgi:hypothetical protein
MFARNAVVYTVFAVVACACACAEHDAAPLDAPQAPIVPLPTLPSLPRLPSPEIPIPNEEPYTWADFCSATTTEIQQMQRVRGPHIVPVGTLPVYDDPTDPLVYDPGHFNKDPLQAPTTLTPDWANMVQQELCNLVEELGTTLDGEDDAQLATLFAQGTFTPILSASASPAFTYSTQVGAYMRVGPWVHARIVIGWTNNDDTKNANNAVIVPPYAPEASTTWTGVLDYFNSNFGTAGASFTTACFALSAALGGIQVQGRATTMSSTATSLAYGDSDARVVAGAIWYKTNGTFNY